MPQCQMRRGGACVPYGPAAGCRRGADGVLYVCQVRLKDENEFLRVRVTFKRSGLLDTEYIYIILQVGFKYKELNSSMNTAKC